MGAVGPGSHPFPSAVSSARTHTPRRSVVQWLHPAKRFPAPIRPCHTHPSTAPQRGPWGHHAHTPGGTARAPMSPDGRSRAPGSGPSAGHRLLKCRVGSAQASGGWPWLPCRPGEHLQPPAPQSSLEGRRATGPSEAPGGQRPHQLARRQAGAHLRGGQGHPGEDVLSTLKRWRSGREQPHQQPGG